MHKSLEEAKKLNQQSRQQASFSSGEMNAVNMETNQLNSQFSGSDSDQQAVEEAKQQNRESKQNKQ